MKALKELSLQQTVPFLALLAVAVLTVIPLFSIGVNTSDDFQYYVTAQQSWDYWAMDHYYYAITGRFYFLVTKYFYYVPYLLDSFFAAKLIQYATLFASYALFSYLVGKVLRSRRIALIVLLILLINTVATPPSYFIAVTCYPFYFSFSLIVFLLGCWCYVAHYQHNGHPAQWRPWVGGLLIFLSFLFYETYLVFALMLGIYVVVRHWRRDGLRQLLHDRRFYVEAMPLLLAAVIYIAVYVGYRLYVGTHLPDNGLYDGTSFNAATFSLANAFRVLCRCTVMALPGQPYFFNKNVMADASLSLDPYANTPLYVLGHASPSAWMCALLAGALLWWLTRRPVILGWKRWLAVVGVGVAVAFLAHSLIALSEKYNGQWSSWMKGYVTTFYSYFGVALVLMALVVASLRVVRSTVWRSVVRAIWVFLVFFFTLLNGFSNEHFARALAVNKNRVDVLNRMGSMGYFDQMPDGALLYTDALHRISKYSFDIANNTEDIEDLINLRAKPQLQCTYKYDELQEMHRANPDAPVYFLTALATQRAGEMLAVVAAVDSLPDDPADARTSHADLFYLSPEKRFTVVYSSASGTHCFGVEAPPREALSRCSIDGEDINPWEIFVSNMVPHSHYRP